MVKTLAKIFLIGTIFSSFCLAQTNSNIYKQNEQLKKIKNEITELEKQLGAKEREEKESLSILNKISEQSLLLNKLINNLEYEERQKEKQIANLNTQISKVESRIAYLKGEYSRYVVWIYKNGKASYANFIFNAESVNQAISRYKYLNSITKKNTEVLKELESQKVELALLSDQVSKEVEEKDVLVKQKKVENTILSKRKTEKSRLVKELKLDQQSIENEIRQKQQAEILIKNLIAKLIEEERQRQAKLREAKLKNESTKGIPDYNYDKFESFVNLQGKLNWPITSGDIFRKFGENKNERLKTVTLNYGIDIRADEKSDVLAVAEGIVSAIDWIPGYGSVMIVTHKGNFRTVYGHLTDIYVNEGDQVNGGTRIAKVSDSLEGRIMHFEIWNERNYQNPEAWLIKRR